MASTVGEVKLKLSFDSSKISTDQSKVQSQLTSSWSKTGAMIANVMSTAFTKVASVITNNISSAVSRADTLDRFPKVMAQLGYSTDDATVAINKLRDGVQGLPTSLADVTSATQRLVTITKDVGQASDWALAISDAMAANGATSEDAARAMEQFIQVISRGKPQGQDWNTIMEVAPGSMDALARSMGYTSALMGGDFYTAFQSGEVSVQQVMDAMVNLDKNGTGAIASFHDQAMTAAGGIQTAMTTMGQGIQNAMVEIINNIGIDNITGAISGLKDVFVGIVKVIGGIVQIFIAWKDVIAPVVAGIVGAIAVIKAMQTAVKIWTGVQVALNAVLTANPLGLLVAAIAAVVGAITWFLTQTEAGQAVLQELQKVAGAVFGAIGGFLSEVGAKVSEYLGPILDWIGEVWGKVQPVLAQIIGGVTSAVGTLVGVISKVFSAITTALAPLVNFYKNAYGAIFSTVFTVMKNILTVVTSVIGAIFSILGTVAQWVNTVVIQPIVTVVTWLFTTVMTIFTTLVNWINACVIQPLAAFFTSLFNTVTGVFTGVASFITGVFSGIAAGAQGVCDFVGSVFNGVASFITGGVINPIRGAFDALWSGVAAGCSAVGGVIGNIFGASIGVVRGVINGIISGINGVIDMVNSIQVPDWVPGIGGASANIGKIPYLAGGGLAYGATTAVIGEAGREAVLPLENNTDNWSGLLADTLLDELDSRGDSLGGGIVVNMTNNIASTLDAQEIGRTMVNSIRRASI